MTKAIATVDLFIGWRGQAIHVQSGHQWEIDHPLVQEKPELFAFPDGGDPRIGTGASLPLQKVDEGAPVVEEPPADSQPEETSPGPEEALLDDGEDEPPYEEWTVPELQVECEARNLPKTGNKPQLVARLNKDDLEAEAK